MDSQACGAHSSTSNALMQEAVSPSKAALSVDTSGAVSPQSSTLSWMSETEDRGKAHSDTWNCYFLEEVNNYKLFGMFYFLSVCLWADSKSVCCYAQ